MMDSVDQQRHHQHEQNYHTEITAMHQHKPSSLQLSQQQSNVNHLHSQLSSSLPSSSLLKSHHLTNENQNINLNNELFETSSYNNDHHFLRQSSNNYNDNEKLPLVNSLDFKGGGGDGNGVGVFNELRDHKTIVVDESNIRYNNNNNNKLTEVPHDHIKTMNKNDHENNNLINNNNNLKSDILLYGNNNNNDISVVNKLPFRNNNISSINCDRIETTKLSIDLDKTISKSIILRQNVNNIDNIKTKYQHSNNNIEINDQNNQQYMNHQDIKKINNNQATSNSPSLLKMKPPDFSKIGSMMTPAQSQNHTGSYNKTQELQTSNPDFTKVTNLYNSNNNIENQHQHIVNHSNLADHIKKNNYISDLQLKKPITSSTVTTTTPNSSATLTSSYSNLYVKAPDFSKNKYQPNSTNYDCEPTAHVIHKYPYINNNTNPSQSNNHMENKSVTAAEEEYYRKMFNYPNHSRGNVEEYYKQHHHHQQQQQQHHHQQQLHRDYVKENNLILENQTKYYQNHMYNQQQPMPPSNPAHHNNSYSKSINHYQGKQPQPPPPQPQLQPQIQHQQQQHHQLHHPSSSGLMNPPQNWPNNNNNYNNNVNAVNLPQTRVIASQSPSSSRPTPPSPTSNIQYKVPPHIPSPVNSYKSTPSPHSNAASPNISKMLPTMPPSSHGSPYSNSVYSPQAPSPSTSNVNIKYESYPQAHPIKSQTQQYPSHHQHHHHPVSAPPAPVDYVDLTKQSRGINNSKPSSMNFQTENSKYHQKYASTGTLNANHSNHNLEESNLTRHLDSSRYPQLTNAAPEVRHSSVDINFYNRALHPDVSIRLSDEKNINYQNQQYSNEKGLQQNSSGAGYFQHNYNVNQPITNRPMNHDRNYHSSNKQVSPIPNQVMPHHDHRRLNSHHPISHDVIVKPTNEHNYPPNVIPRGPETNQIIKPPTERNYSPNLVPRVPGTNYIVKPTHERNYPPNVIPRGPETTQIIKPTNDRNFPPNMNQSGSGTNFMIKPTKERNFSSNVIPRGPEGMEGSSKYEHKIYHSGGAQIIPPSSSVKYIPPPSTALPHKETMAKSSSKKILPVVPSSSTSIPSQIKKEAPLDLSVKTVKTKADSTGCHDSKVINSNVAANTALPSPSSTSLKVDFYPNFSKHNREYGEHTNPSDTRWRQQQQPAPPPLPNQSRIVGPVPSNQNVPVYYDKKQEIYPPSQQNSKIMQPSVSSALLSTSSTSSSNIRSSNPGFDETNNYVSKKSMAKSYSMSDGGYSSNLNHQPPSQYQLPPQQPYPIQPPPSQSSDRLRGHLPMPANKYQTNTTQSISTNAPVIVNSTNNSTNRIDKNSIQYQQDRKFVERILKGNSSTNPLSYPGPFHHSNNGSSGSGSGNNSNTTSNTTNNNSTDSKLNEKSGIYSTSTMQSSQRKRPAEALPHEASLPPVKHTRADQPQKTVTEVYQNLLSSMNKNKDPMYYNKLNNRDVRPMPEDAHSQQYPSRAPQQTSHQYNYENYPPNTTPQSHSTYYSSNQLHEYPQPNRLIIKSNNNYPNQTKQYETLQDRHYHQPNTSQNYNNTQTKPIESNSTEYQYRNWNANNQTQGPPIATTTSSLHHTVIPSRQPITEQLPQIEQTNHRLNATPNLSSSTIDYQKQADHAIRTLESSLNLNDEQHPVRNNVAPVSTQNTNTLKGADQSVISRLRTSLEIKEIEKQKLLKRQNSYDMIAPVSLSQQQQQHQTLSASSSLSNLNLNQSSNPPSIIGSGDRSDDVEESGNENRRSIDINSSLAARIRTKGELKGYIPIPNPSLEVTENISLKTLDPPSDMEGVEKFDLLDWDKACNDFVEELETGGNRIKKVTKRKKSNIIKQKKVDVIIKEEITPIKPDTTEKLTSSSDEDKPLLHLRQQNSNENNSDNPKPTVDIGESQSQISNENTNPIEILSEKIERNLKEKQRIEREKRLAERLGESSSDSEVDPAVIRSRKRIRKPKTRGSILLKSRTSIESSGDESIDKKKMTIPKEETSEIDIKDKLKTETNETSVEITATDDKNDKTISSHDDDDKNQSNHQITPIKKIVKTEKSSSEDEQKSKNVKKLGQPTKAAVKCQITPTKVDETMTRSKRKREIEQQLSNSKVLRNEKIIQNIQFEGRNKSVKQGTTTNINKVSNSRTSSRRKESTSSNRMDETKRKTIDSDDEGGTDATPSKTNQKKICRTSKSEQHSSSSSSHGSSSSGSESGESEHEVDDVTKRLRPRKSTSTRQNETTTTVTPLAAKNSLDDKSKTIKEETLSGSNNKTNTKTSIKRGSANKLTNSLTSLDSSSSTSKTPVKNDESIQKFPPGWEEDFYQYKRSLKVPPSLISIRSTFHRISTSLPDLDHSSDASENFSVSSIEKTNRVNNVIQTTQCNMSLRRTTTRKTITPIPIITQTIKPTIKNEIKDPITPTTKSFIDLLHQRVIRPNSKLQKQKLLKPVISTEPKLIPKSNENELLPTPGAENEEIFGTKNLFDTAVLKSRTRTEHRVLKTKEIIREVFGGDDRPASAPPLGQEAIIFENESISECVTFDQKYEFLQKINIDFEDKLNRPRPNITDTLLQIKKESIDDDAGIIINNNSLFNDSSIKLESTDVTPCQTPTALSERSTVTPVSFRALIKRKKGNRSSRRKGSSGFDYIRKKKKPTPQISSLTANEIANQNLQKKKLAAINEKLMNVKDENDVSREVKSWVLNKGVGESVLHKASRLGYIDVIAYCLIRLDMDADPKDNAGYTPLHEACSRGFLEISRLLLQHGADPSITAQSGIRPLHEAIESNNIEIVRLMLSYGADPLLATYAGQTPLMLSESDEMTHYLKSYLYDIQNTSPTKTPWKFLGAWKKYDPDIEGYDIFDDPPKSNDEPDTSIDSSATTTPIKINHSISDTTEKSNDSDKTKPINSTQTDLNQLKNIDESTTSITNPLIAATVSKLNNNINNRNLLTSSDFKNKYCSVVLSNITSLCTTVNSIKTTTSTTSSNTMHTSTPNPITNDEKLSSNVSNKFISSISGFNKESQFNNIVNTSSSSSISNNIFNKKTNIYFPKVNNAIVGISDKDNNDKNDHNDDYNDDDDDCDNESGDDLFEFEESDIPLPPLYLLKDEGTDKWVLYNDLCNLLKIKSKDTLLKQICPTSPPALCTKELIRELKTSDFLEKATCLQLLCAGEKLNIRANKVVLVRYNESVRTLLGVKTIMMTM